MSGGPSESVAAGGDEPDQDAPTPTTITLPSTAASFGAVKGIMREPAARPSMSPDNREALLGAIAKAHGWIEDLRLGRVAASPRSPNAKI
jgi:hypothetical protein